MSKQWTMFAVFGALVTGAWLGSGSTAHADEPTDVVCRGFYDFATGEKTVAAKEELSNLTAAAAPNVVETWMEKQLAEGRTNFQSHTLEENGGVLCAW